MADPGADALVFVISGPGGAGKGTLVAELLSRDRSLWLSRSWSTRDRRVGEAADAYHFVDRQAFEERIADGGFLEWTEFLGNLYGTPLPEAPDGSDVLLEIDVQGAAQVAERFPDAVLIFVEAPSRAAQEARLRGRGDPEKIIVERLEKADAEASAAARLGAAVVINHEVGRSVEELEAMIASHRRDRG